MGDAGAEAAPREQLHVYYCKFSGRHALSTECDLAKAPRRRTDGATVLDTEFYAVKLYTQEGSEGAARLIRRRDGSVERQLRVMLGKLPIGYRSEPGGRFLYIYKDALSEHSGAAEEGKAKRPVPPCITSIAADAVQVLLEVDDRPSDKARLLKISADAVRLQIRNGIAHAKANEELQDLMHALLGVRLNQLTVARGDKTRQRRLLVRGLEPAVVFERLEAGL